jgi:hypothetical protein
MKPGMTALGLVTLLLLATELAYAVAATTEVAGNWNGSLEVGSTRLRLRFKIRQTPNGLLTAKMDTLDQGARDIPVDTVKVNGEAVRFEVKLAQGFYEGTLDKTGTKMTGQWHQGLYVLPLALKKDDGTSPEPDYPTPAYAKPGSFRESG